MDIFEQAIRGRLRFQTSKGVLTVEDLWQLDVEVLDEIYEQLTATQQQTSGRSLLHRKSNDAQTLELKIQVVELVVNTKLAEAEAKVLATKRKDKREQLLQILQRQEDAELENLSPDEIRAMLAEL